MQIQTKDFASTLDEIMGDQSMVTLRFDDKLSDNNLDHYTCRLQRVGGALGGSIDCICKLNGEDAWQVRRTQSARLTVGDLLLMIASAPAGTTADAFFSDDSTNTADVVGELASSGELPALTYAPNVCAIPTLGGIITDLPLDTESAARFPSEVQLPVTKEAAMPGAPWFVVDYHGRGVVVTAAQAEALGLTEAPNWVPDLSGVGVVPAAGEIAARLRVAS